MYGLGNHDLLSRRGDHSINNRTGIREKLVKAGLHDHPVGSGQRHNGASIPKQGMNALSPQALHEGSRLDLARYS